MTRFGQKIEQDVTGLPAAGGRKRAALQVPLAGSGAEVDIKWDLGRCGK